MEMLSDAYDDEADLLIDEDENMLASINKKLLVFTQKIDNKTNLIECYACGNEEYRPSDEITIECAFCTACLHCAHYGGCQCWTDLEKFYTNEIHNETTYTTNIKELSK
jgi:late competence protein required for DNA uptake (superfamily II DNA/RNA helicase)